MEESCSKQESKVADVTPKKWSPRDASSYALRKRSPSPSSRSDTNPLATKKQKTSPRDLAINEPLVSPPPPRKSLRRSVGKTRKSLPPVHQSNAELSKAINLELPECERFSELLRSCFQFSVQKLEESLNNADGFDAKCFDTKVALVTQKIKRFTERLSRDGTLKKCTEQDDSLTSTPETEALKDKIRECTLKFANESHTWEKLLEDYKNKAEDLSRNLAESTLTETACTSIPRMPTSQDNVINTKPEYRNVLAQQGAVFDCMELVLDELQESVHLLNSFLEETSQHIQTMSTQLKAKSFKQLEDSPIRKLLKVTQK